MTIAAAIETCGLNVIDIAEKMFIGGASERDSIEALIRELELLVLAERSRAAAEIDWWVLSTTIALGYILVGPLVNRFWQGFCRGKR